MIFDKIKHRNCNCISVILLVSCFLPQNTRTPTQQMPLKLGKSRKKIEKKRLQNVKIIALTFGMIQEL